MTQQKNHLLAVLGVCIASAMGGIVFSELNLAMSSMQLALHASLIDLQWIVNIYGIIVCSTLVVFGRLGDVIGRKKLFLVALIILSIAMLGSGLAHEVGVVIACQALNGIASAIVMPVSQALITNMYPPNKRSKAIGLWAAASGIALGLGPLYSGLVIHLLSWRWVFLFNIPMILGSFLLVLCYAQDSKSDEASPKIDWLGAVILAMAMASFVMMIVQSESWPMSIIICLGMMSSLSFFALFLVESRAEQPIIRKDLFKNRAFVLASFCNCCLLFFIWADFFLMPLYFQTVLHDTPFKAGMLMLLVTVPLTIIAFYSEHSYARFGPKHLISLGFLFLITSSLLQMFFTSTFHNIFIIISTLAFGIAWGFIWTPSATQAISSLPQAHAGTASGTFVTFQEVGGSMGLAITGAVVRFYPTFEIGYSRGMLVLGVVSFIGLLACLKMKKS